jgi:hypothetical protein
MRTVEDSSTLVSGTGQLAGPVLHFEKVQPVVFSTLFIRILSLKNNIS